MLSIGSAIKDLPQLFPSRTCPSPPPSSRSCCRTHPAAQTLGFFFFFLCKMKVFNNNQQRLVVYKYFAGYQVSAMSFFVKAIKTP